MGLYREFKSFYKTVEGNEGSKCHYNTRLDMYGCGCQHDCSYCYAKSLLEFRGLWDPQNPATANLDKIRAKINTLPKGMIVRLGGMTDCFQPIELESRNTYWTIKALNEARIGYLIVTKSDIITRPEYLDILDPELAHIQITVTTLDDDLYREKAYEKATLPSNRIKAIKKLQLLGFDVAMRVSPFIEEYMDIDKLNNLGIRKVVLEFLGVNHWIKKWFDIDYSGYTLKSHGYQHLPLLEKIGIVSRIKVPELTICEDVDDHYDYWKENFNPNKDDCCNLRRSK